MYFDLFDLTAYTFLVLESGLGGNKELEQFETTGVFKSRTGLRQDANAEAYESTSTLHIRPDENFIGTVGGPEKLVGHGVRVDGLTYRIEGVSAGKDYENGSVDFYRATLKRESLWASALPLE